MELIMSIALMRDALMSRPALSDAGTITEYLPAYEELTYRFHEGLNARIASHGNGLYQMTLAGFWHLEPGTVGQVIEYLANVDAPVGGN